MKSGINLFTSFICKRYIPLLQFAVLIWWRKVLKSMVRDRKLTPLERMSSRIGYMGSGFLMISPYLLPYDGIGAYTYLMGALLSLPQVWIAKQWNIVLLNFNLFFLLCYR